MREFLSSYSRIEFDKIRQRIGRYLHTTVGREHIDSLIPLSDPAAITAELEAVTEMKNVLSDGTEVPLRELPDLRVPLQRASIVDFVLPPSDLLAVAGLAANSRELKKFLGDRSPEFPIISSVVSALVPEKQLENDITKAIDEEGRVVDGASHALAAVRRSMRDIGENLRSRTESILRKLSREGLTQEDLITTRDGRMVIPVRAEMKNQVPGFIHSISASGATAFIEPAQTLEMNNELRSLESAEKQEVEKILRELTSRVRVAIPGLTGNIGIIGRIDFLHAKARYSDEIGGFAPAIVTERYIRLKSAIHPLLLQKHRRSEVVPLDLEAGKGFNTLIISGPNAGGKSVAMKTVGLLVAMAQSGCHIPASPDSCVHAFSELFVEMGDDQSIENDLSTFSSHLQNLKTILQHAGRNSLVLIDEIGNGTDPALGSAMGISVLEELSERDCLTIITSHHSAFKTAGFDHGKMENAGMGFDSGTLRPSYRLSVGRPGNSYALEIARNMEFPEKILERSFQLAGVESVKLSDYLTKFEERTRQLEISLKETEKLRAVAQSTIDLYETKLSTVKEELKDLRLKAKIEAADIVAGAKKTVERVVREIRETGASKEAVRGARTDLAALARSTKTVPDKPVKRSGFNAKPGSRVRLIGTSTSGEIIEKVDNGRIVIEAAGKRLIVPIEQLELASQNSTEFTKPNNLTGISEVKNEIDLRGQYGDEAISLVDHFLDSAAVAGFKQVRIIHGKGTGVLRKRVGEYLKNDKRVLSFQLGGWNEGGAGVTIAVLSE